MTKGKKINHGRWTDSEHQRYEEALKMGLSWKKLAKVVASRTIQQCRSHHQKMKINPTSNRIAKIGITMIDACTQYEIPMAEHIFRASELTLNNVERLFKSFGYLSEEGFEATMYLSDALPKGI
ncbi:unnamed protein product [Blepharisma stoltei]|uniref:Uncharacterized protein n=1 Tax=Blepharisma stoltei TaxID=1481888 RepID=A0AAU9IML9_9CILI|nr:unnamed protein product [Blepharisma stoltei]